MMAFETSCLFLVLGVLIASALTTNVVGTSLVALYGLVAAAAWTAWTVDPSPVSVVKFFRV